MDASQKYHELLTFILKKYSPQHLQFQSVEVVFYVPGNHELWVSKEADSNRVMAEEMVL